MGAQWKKKGREQAADAKGRLFTKLAREVIVAARGGADPEMNAALRVAVERAKKASMPRDTLERAIKKGAGLLDEVVIYERVTYEGFAPHKVPVIIECLTENNNRTATNIRMLFRKNGQLGNSGSVSWDFDHLGMIEAVADKPGLDAETAAIEAGAQDVESVDEGVYMFYTDPTDLDAVSRALPDQGFSVNSAQLGYKSRNPVKLDDEARAEVEAFLETIDADDDVQNVYAGLAD